MLASYYRTKRQNHSILCRAAQASGLEHIPSDSGSPPTNVFRQSAIIIWTNLVKGWAHEWAHLFDYLAVALIKTWRGAHGRGVERSISPLSKELILTLFDAGMRWRSYWGGWIPSVEYYEWLIV